MKKNTNAIIASRLATQLMYEEPAPVVTLLVPAFFSEFSSGLNNF